MATHDRLLQVLLRVVGTAGLLAIPFVMVPYSWMDAIHQGLGMGKLPDAPVVGYLARSASAFYAILGGLLWTVSFDLRRHRIVVSYIGFAVILFGVAILAVDLRQGMPIWWSLAEGPFNVAFGAVFVWLSWRMDKPGRLPPFRRGRSVSRAQSSGGQIGDDGATTWIIFEFLGGPSDGKSVQGALGDGGDAERYYLFTTTMIRLAPWVMLLAACHLSLAGNGDGGEAGWTSLFNGENLDGWGIKCRPADQDKTGYWKVVDGTITAETLPGSKHHYIWLLTEQEYSDFALRLKVQTYSKTTGNSGIQLRSRYDDEAGWLDGPQVDINPPGPWRNGFIYDETRGVQVWLWPNVGKPANAKPEHAPQESKWFHADDGDAWNEIQVICRGTRITTVVNGVTIADYDGAGRLDDETHRNRNVGMKGRIGLQIHPGNELLIRFKDIEVRQP